MATALNFVQLAATALLVGRILVSGLSSRYRVFWFFLIFEVLRGGTIAFLNSGSNIYQKVWVLSEPVEWVLYVWVVLEIYSRVLEDYVGLATVGKWALIVAVGVALLASGLTLTAPSQHTGQGHLMQYYYVAERAVYFSLVVFLLTILGILMQYPITLSRNIIVHSTVFSVYFLSGTVIYLLLSARGFYLMRVVEYASLAVNLAALGAWLALLNPAGEVRKVRLRPAWMPGREEDLVNQLNQLNAALLRATRK
ncbi:MAG TPA: hypothetical protein VMU80_19540 [Bryobacteraceae bacterium]|nr:hypothetical protein [Bryobacteraceae bacterium]